MLPLHGLFIKQVRGDEALLRLARLRFEQAGLAAEAYADDAPSLELALRFVPPDARPPTVHLSRGLDLLSPAGHEHVAQLIRGFGHRVSGFVVHDREHLPDRTAELKVVADRQSALLLAGSGQAWLFIEYAVGVRPERFAAVGEALRDIDRVGLCLDTGHVGIRQARRAFAALQPDLGELTALKVTDPRLPQLADDVQAAVASGLPTLLELIHTVATQGKRVHFHLHDGHPLTGTDPQDHFGFLTRPAIPFRRGGMASLDPLYGVRGLTEIVRTIAAELGPDRASLTLEIHQHTGRLPLPPDEARRIFSRWVNLTNAERQNSWLRELADNAVLVRAALADQP